MTNNTPQPIHLTSGGTIYEQVGGMETFVRLAGAFYARVDRDASIRAMFPDNLRQSAAHLALFLAQFFGGPTTYGEQRGHPRLRMRHLPFRIGQAERDAWVGHMVAAMDEVGIPEPARSAMCDYFERAATFLINAADQPGGGT
jgi:hemoglobin